MKIAILYSYAPQEGIIKALKDDKNIISSFFYGIDKPSILKRIYWKLFGSPNAYITKQFNIKLKKIYIQHQQNPFDRLLIIKGKKINAESELILSRMNDVYKILWTTDSITRHPEQIAVKKYIDKIFVQDGSDVNLIKNSSWLPLGFDKDVFKYNKTKNIDILLFGNCNIEYYSKRLNYFMEATKLAHKYKIIFVGSNIPSSKKDEFESKGIKIYKTIPFNKFVELISLAKICVNVHQDDGEKAINPIFFAIPACGSVQVTDKRDYYSEWLTPNKDYFPTEINKLTFLLDKILNNFAEYQLTKQEVKTIINQHSFHGRVKILLNIADEIN